MSFSETIIDSESARESNKRKRETNEEDIEIDINAPEPPSKKALRRAKKLNGETSKKADETSLNLENKVIGAEDVVPNRGKRSEYGIWIGNLSFSTTKQDLVNFMTSDTVHNIANEKLTRINLPAGPAKFGKFQNKGFAYIDLLDGEALQSALQLSEKLLGGRRVLIKNANSFEGRPKESGKEALGRPPSKRIFVGNLNFDTTVESLEEHFAPCGPIQNTHMATFEDSGKCKGYAWIEFEQLSSGQAAMRGWVEEGVDAGSGAVKQSKQRIWIGKIDGRKLRMEYAEDKTTRYNKRFGKNAPQEKRNEGMPAIEEIQTNDKQNAFGAEETRQEQRPRERSRKQRYNDETVKRLTGAIVEGQGSKVKFD